MELIDLTHPITDAMPVYPSDSPVRLFQEKVLEKDHYNNFRLETNLHAGTHIDSPAHLTQSSNLIDAIPLETFIGNACVLDVRGRKEIKYLSDFEERVKENDIVLLFTGHDREFGKDLYFKEYPSVDKALAEFFISKRIKMLGIDAPSPDYFPFAIHKLFFKCNIPIIENLTNLGILIFRENIEIMAFPLKLRADSSLVRVVARTEKPAALETEDFLNQRAKRGSKIKFRKAPSKVPGKEPRDGGR